jgi:hypothetical protein
MHVIGLELNNDSSPIVLVVTTYIRNITKESRFELGFDGKTCDKRKMHE